jgi:hypothetical protein
MPTLNISDGFDFALKKGDNTMQKTLKSLSVASSKRRTLPKFREVKQSLKVLETPIDLSVSS